MIKPRATAAASSYRDRNDHTVLVLQGGGALGAYQAGVYEAMSDVGFAPDWVTGVSIGAINAALIAGNPVERRLQRLRAFWERVSSGIPLLLPPALDPLRVAFNRFSATATTVLGVPGFFRPRMPPPYFAAKGTDAALSFYDTTPLLETLSELVDFELINAKNLRFAVGAVHVTSGNSVYFDNYLHDKPIGPEHVMASGALPPGFAPVTIDGEPYWDGGLVSNTPLWYVLDDDRHLEALILQVDLFSANGDMPTNLNEVLEREKDIQYSSKTRFNTKRVKELETLRGALRRVLASLPARLRDSPDAALLANVLQERKVSVVQLINRRFQHSSESKDYEFSRATVRMLWDAGREAVHRTVAHPDWQRACSSTLGLHAYDLASE